MQDERAANSSQTVVLSESASVLSGAKETLSEVPSPDEPLLLNLELWLTKSVLSLLMSSISLPAFREWSKTLRMLLGLATLEQVAPYLSIHRVQ